MAQIIFDSNKNQAQSCFSAIISWPAQADASVIVDGDQVSIPAGKTATVQVVVELNHLPANTNNATHITDSFTFDLFASLNTQGS